MQNGPRRSERPLGRQLTQRNGKRRRPQTKRSSTRKSHRMKKIRETHIDRATLLRLVDTGNQFIVLSITGGTTKVRIERHAAEDVGKRLLDEAAKANPKYVGFAGARNRFLHFFPNGFHSEGYEREERGYKMAAKTKLDQTAPRCRRDRRIGFRRSDTGGVPGDEPAITIREDATARRAPRNFSRCVYSRRCAVHDRAEPSRARRHGARAETP